MGNRARKDRKLAGLKFEKEAKVPTGTYVSKETARKKCRRMEDAKQRAFVAAARMATWPPPKM